MGCLGNVIWFLCGGLWQGLAWTISGIFWCITIIGIPIGCMAYNQWYSACHNSVHKRNTAMLYNYRHTVWHEML